jgi:exodeoxyribonuclease VII small subunit
MSAGSCRLEEDRLTDAPLPDVGRLSFEVALKELEQIVAKLERGDVPLEESIAIY